MDDEKKHKRGGWKSAIFIIFVEVAERFAYYGVAANLFGYLTTELHQAITTAAKNVNTWMGVSALFPVAGGFIADSYAGRFKTIVVSSIIYLTGLIVLTVSVSAVPLSYRAPVFFLALYILAVGEGGHKPCVQTFAADQFDDTLPEERAAKSSFFNWWYVGIVCGATSAVLVVLYVQDNVGWVVGFGMLAAAVAAALVVFLVGIGNYRREAPVGSPFTRVAQVVVAAVKKRGTSEKEGRGICEDDHDDDSSGVPPLSRTEQFRFLDKASIVDSVDASLDKRDPWRLCPMTQVEEVKLLLQLVPIWFSCLMFAIVIAQLGTYFTKQGSTLAPPKHVKKFPPASMQVFTGLTILTSVLLYERALVPLARSLTGNQSGITMLQRIGFGLFLSVITMTVAALVETKRVNVARQHGLLDNLKSGNHIPMSIMWLLPQYMLMGLSDVFTIVGLQELFYDQMPVAMRSLGAAAYISVTGVGSFLSAGLIIVVQGISSRAGHVWLGNNINRANVQGFYWVLACMSAVNLCGYVVVSRRFVYKKKSERGILKGNKESEKA